MLARQSGHCVERWNHLARQFMWKKCPQLKAVSSSPLLYPSRQMVQLCCSEDSKRTWGKAWISSSESLCPVRTVPSCNTLRTLLERLSSRAKLSAASLLSTLANPPSRPPSSDSVFSRAVPTVRADCWTLMLSERLERAVDKLLRIVSPKPQTDAVSSRMSAATPDPNLPIPTFSGLTASQSRDVPGGLLPPLRGLSKPSMVATPSSSSLSAPPLGAR
mmetsp:Transcript_73326/g.191333  ORF Transcript_73326/g.191333 Transcript_73326/m.191333 type:complete len:218 (-) Transcript_73326:377-1030(-)